MKILFLYIKYHYKYVFTLILFALIFSAIFSLYNLPMEAVLYSLVLCAFFGVIMLISGCIHFKKKHEQLNILQKTVLISLDSLPRSSNLIEEDYGELLRILKNENAHIIAKAEMERQDLIDYYTIWVHQIKTPISAMHLLLQNDDGETSSQMSIELLRIEQYVQMVLSYLRLDSETSDFVLREYDLDEIIRQAVRKYAKLFILKKLPLDYTTSGLKVLTDEKWLSFVLEQLLSNSLKYTYTGSIRIYTSGKTLIVEDTGIGISAEDLPRVFEKGFTGYNGRENKKSTGIGLYLCRRICDKLGHGISIESKPGNGTKVMLNLESAERVIE